MREAEAARQVASFCTAAVLDADFEATPAYIVSEFVEGPSLSEAVRRDGPLTGGDLNRVAVATATALMAIHEGGIVHRDFKPANVLLGPGGARVIDFGVAQVRQGTGTLTNSSIGTPAYMAPEQISGDPVSPATDVYAWGAVMVFAATGRQPFRGATVPAILHQVLNGDPDLSGVPEPLRMLAVSAMQKDPAQRPGSTDILMTLIGRKERPVGHDEATRVMSEAAASVSEPQGPAPSTARLGDAAASTRVGPGGAFLLGQSLGGSETGTGGDSGDTAGAPTSEASADDGSNEPQPPPIPEFNADYAGSWEGLVEDGTLYTMEIDEGERTANLVDDENADCFYALALTETDDNGYAGTFEDELGFCQRSVLSGDARLGLEDGFLLVELNADNGEEIQVRLQRADA